MASTIHPMSEYYFRNGVFVLKSKAAKVARVAIAASIIAAGIFLTPSVKQSGIDLGDGISYAVKEAALVDYVKGTNKNISSKEAYNIIGAMSKWSKEHEVELSLLVAIAKVESTFNKHAMSNAGALGIMQIMPQWHLTKMKKAQQVIGSPEPFNVETNVFIGSLVIKDCITTQKTLQNALKCYNGSLSMQTGYDERVLNAKREIDRLIKGVI